MNIITETAASAEYRKGTTGMAKRLITAAVGVPIGIFILVLNNAHILAAVTAVLSAIAVFEVLSAAKYTKFKSLTVLSLLFSVVVPISFCYEIIRPYLVAICFAFLILLFAFTIIRHKEVRFEQLGFAALITICVPLAISTIAFFAFRFPEHGFFFVVYTLVVTWVADGGAYFAGTFFGKHKLCPSISPKKTWEGFIGGLITSVIFAVLLGYGYPLWDKIFTGEEHFSVNILIVALCAAVCAFLGLLGDLIASLLKRQCGVKDFGNLLPGHGGVMDRFDSVLFTAPFIYLVFQHFNPITALA